MLKRARRSLLTASLTVTPLLSHASSVTPGSTTNEEPMSVAIGEPLLSDYSVHELPSQRESGTAFAVRVKAKTKHLRTHIDVKKAPLMFRVE